MGRPAGTSSGFDHELEVHSPLKRGDSVIVTARRSTEKIHEFPQSDRLHTLQPNAITYFGRIDMVLNNAGVGYKAVLERAGSDVLREQYDTNFFELLDVTNICILGETLNAELVPFGPHNRIVDYDTLLEAEKQGIAAAGANFRGEPTKAMELLVDVMHGEGRAARKTWPLYLPMCELVVSATRGQMAKMLEVVDEWQDVICNLNFEK
ncbi:hypothetical protein C8Q79DRAFT_1113645 [Trametes meyenii]|nr:hypothetical protein C8Q79DRAFT_1113645 [Trametes meyenii]